MPAGDNGVVEDAGAPREDEVPQGAAAAARQKRKRPKVTFDLLKTTAGLPDVYHNLPTLFKQQRRGNGVSDLRRLLEMFKRWQERIFPHCEFDTFVANVEKLSSSNVVKKEVQDMRVDLLRTVETTARGSAEHVDEAPPSPVENATAQEGDGEGLELDNELLELAADPVDEGGDELDDDTLVALALENGGPEGDTAGDGEILGLADNDGLEALDDDELLELAMQGIAE